MAVAAAAATNPKDDDRRTVGYRADESISATRYITLYLVGKKTGWLAGCVCEREFLVCNSSELTLAKEKSDLNANDRILCILSSKNVWVAVTIVNIPAKLMATTNKKMYNTKIRLP